MAVKIITPPTAEPISLDEVKLNLRVVNSDEDADITRMISAARCAVEGKLNRFLMPQTVEMAADYFPWPYVWDPSNPTGLVRLQGGPFVSMVNVKYTDGSGAEQTLDPSIYVVNDYTEPVELSPTFGNTWPITRLQAVAVKIRYNVGYADAAHVPESIKQWLHMAIGTMYENRETSSDKPLYGLPDDFMNDLIQPYKVYQ